MAHPQLQPDEEVLARAGVQLARGFPQTAGELFLTSRRLVLIPSQFLSMGFGKSLEIPLDRIRAIKPHGRFQGGTLIGSAGRKIEVVLDDNTRHTFSFFLNADPDAFYTTLEGRHLDATPHPSPPPSATPATRPFPKPRRTVWFWLNVAGTLAAAALLIYACADIVRRW